MQYMFIYFWHTGYAAQFGLEVAILLLVLSQYWDFRHVSTWSIFVCFYKLKFIILCVWKFCLHVHLSVHHCVSGACGIPWNCRYRWLTM